MKKSNFKLWSTLLALVSVQGSFASAPLSTAAQAPFARIHVGDIEVTALSDGTVDLPMSKLLNHIKPAEYQKAIKENYLNDPIETSVNGFLINTGAKLVLVDTGAGKLFGPTLGKILGSIKAAGYQPEQVDAILITHMHPDHVGGLSADGKMVFPNATLYVDKAESDFWLSKENLDKAPEANKGFFQGAIASVTPYLTAAKIKYLTSDTEIVPGIKSHPSHGHTAGHTTYFVESKGQKIALIGDLIHVGSVQFSKPSITIQFDGDQKQAEAARRAAFTEAAKEDYLVGASHLAFPGIGHIRTDKSAYRFVPVNYTR